MQQDEWTALAAEACGWFKANPHKPAVQLELRTWAKELRGENVRLLREAIRRLRDERARNPQQKFEFGLPPLGSVVQRLREVKREQTLHPSRQLEAPAITAAEYRSIATQIRGLSKNANLASLRRAIEKIAGQLDENADRRDRGEPTKRVAYLPLVKAMCGGAG